MMHLRPEEDIFMLLQNTEDEIMPLFNKFNTDQPTIEKFEFVENGRTLSAHGILHFKVWVYDSGTEVNSVIIGLSGRTSNYHTISYSKDDSPLF